MAININSLTLPITPMGAKQIIEGYTEKLGVFLDLDRIYELIGIFKLENVKLAKELCVLCLDSSFNPNDQTSVRKMFIKVGIDERDLFLQKTPSIAAKVLKPLMESEDYSEEIVAILKTYLKFSSNKTVIGTLTGYALLPRCKVLSWNGHRMVLAKPEYVMLATMRIQAANPNIQGIARKLGDLITYPNGYILIRTDSGQIEPRINFSYYLVDELIKKLITYYDDAYYGIMHFCTMSEGERAACRSNFEYEFVPIVITPDVESMRNMLKTLTNAGSYGSKNLNNVNLQLANAYSRYIVNHPSRLALERKVAEQLARGDNTFYGAFGSPITPTDTEKYKAGTAGWEGHLSRCGVNNPVQTTASELMTCSVYEANKILAPYPNSYICYYKHDEGAFLVSEKDAESSNIVEELSDITAYNVMDWIPIPADCLIGMKTPTIESYL